MGAKFLEDVVCNDLDEVCEEVKRQLRMGNQVEINRYMSSPAYFLVSSYVDRVPPGDLKQTKLARVTGYFGN